MIQVHSFAYGYPVVLELSVEKVVLLLLDGCGALIGNVLTCGFISGFLNSIQLVCILMLLCHCAVFTTVVF